MQLRAANLKFNFLKVTVLTNTTRVPTLRWICLYLQPESNEDTILKSIRVSGSDTHVDTILFCWEALTHRNINRIYKIHLFAKPASPSAFSAFRLVSHSRCINCGWLMQHTESLALLPVSSHWQRARFYFSHHCEKPIQICWVKKFRTEIIWIGGFGREILKIGAQQQDAKDFCRHFQSPLWLRISKLLIDINELKLQHSRVLGNFIIPSAKRKTETQGKWLACGLSAQLLEEQASGFQRKPHGTSIRGNAVASFGERGWCLVSSSPRGHKCNTFCLCNGTRGLLSPPYCASQRITAGEQLVQICSVQTPQRRSKEGGALHKGQLAFIWT